MYPQQIVECIIQFFERLGSWNLFPLMATNFLCISWVLWLIFLGYFYCFCCDLVQPNFAFKWRLNPEKLCTKYLESEHALVALR